MVAAKHDLPNANLRSKVAKCFGTEDQGVKIKLLEVFSRLLFQRDIRIASRRVDETGVIRPVGVGWQKPTAVSRDNLEAREGRTVRVEYRWFRQSMASMLGPERVLKSPGPWR